ncbi:MULTISPECIES: hypothetical protein [Marinomonas]|uniref:Uncharacterized protein n=1 Tax=Marinomonas alcarazii TaxID=491949 RepID=A0A318UW19_9GAMM|nr:MULTISPECIES: hypothetical protein [Marinomonas]PYF79600.1 hypothetical protein DFP75_108123 [Marinomonas alcarazii]
MRELNIADLECVGGGVGPLVTVPVKMAVGGVSSALGYTITNAIQGQEITQKGLITSFSVGALSGGGASSLRTSVLSSTGGAVAGNVLDSMDGSNYCSSDGTSY